MVYPDRGFVGVAIRKIVLIHRIVCRGGGAVVVVAVAGLTREDDLIDRVRATAVQRIEKTPIRAG